MNSASNRQEARRLESELNALAYQLYQTSDHSHLNNDPAALRKFGEELQQLNQLSYEMVRAMGFRPIEVSGILKMSREQINVHEEKMRERLRKAAEASSFVSIETVVPEWFRVREVLEPLVPERLKFIIDPNKTDSVMVDYLWMQQFLDMAPGKSMGVVGDHCRRVQLKMAEYISRMNLNKHWGMIREKALEQINHDVELWDRYQQDRGLPTSQEVLRHYLGLTLCMALANEDLKQAAEELRHA